MSQLFTKHEDETAGVRFEPLAGTEGADHMPVSKRVLDLMLVLILAFPALLLGTGIVIWLLLAQGWPVLFRSERIGAGLRPFILLKFRTMADAPDDGVATGPDKAARITPPGRWLRASRLDELPQLWNILRGDMSFVGPRPPLARYVRRHPGLYAQVLRARPGLTGLATLSYHDHEVRVLGRCADEGETDRVYSRRCVPRKARLDLLYQRRHSVRLDMWILLSTLKRLVRRGRSGPRQ